MRAAAVSALAAALSLVAAGSAHAGQLTANSGGMVYSAFIGESNHVTIEQDDDFWYVRDAGADLQVADDDLCAVSPDPRFGGCPRVPGGFILVNLIDGADSVDASVVADRVFVCGGEGNDTLLGGAGADALAGDAGGDDLNGGPGADFLYGSVSDFSAQCGPTRADLPGERNRLSGGGGDDVLLSGPARDTSSGGDGDDYLWPGAGDDVLDGGAGSDALAGDHGADVLDGGDGDDFLGGGPGDDDLRGGPGADELGMTFVLKEAGQPRHAMYEDGDDSLDGGAGDDILNGGPGRAPFLNPGVVDDGLPLDPLVPLTGSNGDDRLSGGDGSDLVTYANRADPLALSLNGVADDGTAGEVDRIGIDVERVTGGAGGDRLTGGPEGDELDGARGADTVLGGPGGDRLSGGSEDDAVDSLFGGPGADELDGGAGNDELRGGGGPDALVGEGGNDTLAGEIGDDTMRAGRGDDLLVDVAGANVFDGEEGVDRIDFGASDRPVRVSLDDRRDDGPDGADLVVAVENVDGTTGADVLIGNAGANRLAGGAGADYVDGQAGRDDLRGGEDRDAILSRDDEADAVDCGADEDVATLDDEDTVAEEAGGACEQVVGDAGGGPVVVTPVGCTAQVTLAPLGPLPLAEPSAVGPQAVVDARSCPVDVTGRTRARVGGGAFSARESGRGAKRRLLVRLRTERGACRGRALLARVSVAARGLLLLQAAESRASAKRATWTTDERCDGTLTRVQRGTVRVSDGGKNRRLRRGRSYLARRG